MKKYLAFVLLGIILVMLAACAAGPNDAGVSADPGGKPAGFWLGLWHGFIAPFTLIVSLFNHNIAVFANYNNGGWYTFGFIFGILIFLGGGNRAGRKKWKREKKPFAISEEK